jgi:hypothetical protein
VDALSETIPANFVAPTFSITSIILFAKNSPVCE